MYFVMPDLIRHPVFLFLDSGQRTTLVRFRRNDGTAASRGEWTPGIQPRYDYQVAEKPLPGRLLKNVRMQGIRNSED